MSGVGVGILVTSTSSAQAWGMMEVYFRVGDSSPGTLYVDGPPCWSTDNPVGDIQYSPEVRALMRQLGIQQEPVQKTFPSISNLR